MAVKGVDSLSIARFASLRAISNDAALASRLVTGSMICFNSVMSTTGTRRQAPRDDPRDRERGRRLDRHRLARAQRATRRRRAETRGAVLRVVRDHGFTANRSARALSGGRTGLIGVMLPIVEATYFTSILSGAAEALYEQDMRMVLCPTLHHHEREVTLLDRLMHGTTDGAVLMLPEESNERAQDAAAQGLRVRDRRPARGARRGHPGRLGRQRLGCPRGDRAPARRSATGGSARSRARSSTSRAPSA